MMRILAPMVALAAAFTATPALATGDIVCEAEGASVSMLIGRLPVLTILRGVVDIGDKTWSTEPNAVPGLGLAIGQAFEDDRQLIVDFTDANIEEVVGRLRVFSLEEGEDFVSAGVFSMKGEGAYIVDCSLRG